MVWIELKYFIKIIDNQPFKIFFQNKIKLKIIKNEGFFLISRLILMTRRNMKGKVGAKIKKEGNEKVINA